MPFPSEIVNRVARAGRLPALTSALYPAGGIDQFWRLRAVTASDASARPSGHLESRR